VVGAVGDVVGACEAAGVEAVGVAAGPAIPAAAPDR
jgi:hypothetical protein